MAPGAAVLYMVSAWLLPSSPIAAEEKANASSIGSVERRGSGIERLRRIMGGSFVSEGLRPGKRRNL